MNITKITQGILSIGLITLLVPVAQAQSKDSDKLDIKKLEDKYWSAKDDDFTVVQNRAYSKAGRFFATLQGGIPINDPYSTGTLSGASLGYYFSERYGLELNYLSANFSNNNATDDFIVQHKSVPDHNTLKSQAQLQFDYVPLYAKMSFLDKKIIYFDMGLGVFVGQNTFGQAVTTGDQTGTTTAYGISVFQNFFLGEHFALKVDYRNSWGNEDVLHYNGTQIGQGRGARSVNDSSLLIGITFFK